MIRNNNYNLRNFQCLYPTNKRTVKYGTETVTYRGPQIWNLVPEKTKNGCSFDLLKKEIGKWKGKKCPCRICKTYIHHVRFIGKSCIRILFSFFKLLFTFSLCFLWEGGGGGGGGSRF